MSKARYLSLLISLTFFMVGNTYAQLTADKILDKTASLLSDSKGVSADFTVSGNVGSGKGALKGSGSKFYIGMPDVEVWYNGNDMYTYNKRTSETTLIDPTPEELAESNPLLYVKGYRDKFTAKFSPNKKSGKYIIDLEPKSRKLGLQKIILTIRSSDNVPEKIVVTGNNSQTVTFDITAFKSGVTLEATEFNYPKSKYPKVEIIDLR